MNWRAFLDGVASIFTGWAPLQPPPPPMTNEELRQRVAEDMARDWRAVGNDLRTAMRQVDREIGGDG
jgi:hypothetical protein